MIAFYGADVTVPLKQRKLVRKWLEALALQRGYRIESLGYVFCSDEYLLQMNKEYLNHDYFTDVITFPLVDAGNVVVAECYVSVDRIKENAIENGVTFVSELLRVMAHGLLHLTGEDDKDPKAETQMRSAEENALQLWLFHVEQSKHNK